MNNSIAIQRRKTFERLIERFDIFKSLSECTYKSEIPPIVYLLYPDGPLDLIREEDIYAIDIEHASDIDVVFCKYYDSKSYKWCLRIKSVHIKQDYRLDTKDDCNKVSAFSSMVSTLLTRSKQ